MTPGFIISDEKRNSRQGNRVEEAPGDLALAPGSLQDASNLPFYLKRAKSCVIFK